MYGIFKNEVGRFEIRETPDPTPTEDQVLIDVKATSLNFGEVSYSAPDWGVIGWDSAGIILNGGGKFPVGARVVGFGWRGGWATRRVLSVKEVVPIPDTLPLHLAASLPVAGLTALQGLRYGGNLRGKHVLVTGATGGVGRFAIQLGSQMGAEVTALVRKPAHRETLLKLGATRVVTDVSGLERPVDHVIELVGGAMFDQALQAANPTRAMVMLIGDASGERRTATPKPGQQIIQFRVNSALATDLLELVGKLAGGTLDPQIGWRGHWSQINEAADFLMSRQVLGKLVLDIHS